MILKRSYILWLLVALWGTYAIWFTLTYKQELIFADDAGHYNLLAVNMLESFSYSLDGSTPFFAREPGYSVFLAGVYSIFGLQNWFAVLIIQIALFILAVLFFAKELTHWVPSKTSTLFVWLLLLHPALWTAHTVILRESLSASLLLFLFAFLLQLLRTPRWQISAISGLILGILVLVSAPFFLLPIGLISFLLWYKIRPLQIGIILATCAMVIAPWGIRNMQQVGSICIAGCNRSDLQWAVRGEQAETLRGTEPLLCMYAEYISRDWSNRSKNCHFNAVKNRLFPNGFEGNTADAELGAIGREKIKTYLPWYLWHTVFEVLEIHLPYVHSWGLGYNLVVSAYSLFITLAAFIGLALWKRFYLLLLVPVAYSIGVYTLSDAIPRYLLPVLFVYCLLAAVGLEYLTKRYYER